MTDAGRGQITTSAAEVYEDFFVPALFAQFAGPVLDAAHVGSGDRVLDVGCGTGVLARAASERVAPTGSVAAVDPNGDMLAVARRWAPGVRFEDGAAEALPFADATFDRVVSQFALMFFDDAQRAMTEMSRVLAPGGTVAVAVWSSVTHTPGYAAMIDLIERSIGSRAADALRAPFALGDHRLLSRLLEPHFDDVRVDSVEGTARFASIDEWVHTDVRGWTLADMIDDAAYRNLLAAARDEMVVFTDDCGTVRFSAPAVVATGRRPTP